MNISVQHRFKFLFCLRFLLVFFSVYFGVMPTFGIISAEALKKATTINAPKAQSELRLLRVVMDDNYPPYVFRDSSGNIQGILPEQWHLWEKQTGVQVKIIAKDWADAQKMMINGEADVIDTIFYTSERSRIYDFSKPYTDIPVSIFFQETISSIPDVMALRGFAVAVKKGDASIEILGNKAVSTFLYYPSYEAIIQGAAGKSIKVFCMDDPPALYFLRKYKIAHEFRKGFTLYTGQFHRAVKKGHNDILGVVEKGFASIPKKALKAIDEKWFGTPLGSPFYYRHLSWIFIGFGLLVGVIVVWILLLNSAVRQKTRDLEMLLTETRTKEELLRVTLYSLRDGVITTDVAGSVRMMNPVAEHLTGWTKNEARRRTTGDVFQVLHERTREVLDNPVKKVLRENQAVHFSEHTLLIARDGRELPVSGSVAPIRDDGAKITGYVIVFRDQSDERKTKEILRETKERLELALEGAGLGAWDWDIPGRKVVRSRRWAEMLGYDPEEVESDPEIWKEHLHPDDHPRVLNAITLHLEGKSPFYEEEYRLRSRSGNWIWVLDRGKVITKDSSGKPVRAAGVDMDITKRKEMETTLRLLTRAVEQSPTSIVITGPTGNIEYVNPRFCKLTGYNSSEVIGKNPRILKSGKTPADEYRKLWETITSGREWHGFFCNRKKSGQLYWENAMICPIFDETGKITHYLGVKEDITEKKALQDQLIQVQKLESIGRLAGGIAHDFSNMLTVIIGNVQLAKIGVDPRDQIHQDLDEILKAAIRSKDLIRQLLAFARKQTIRPEILDLNQVIGNSEKMLKRLVGEDIEVRVVAVADLWKVKIDPSQVDQILANLTVNARDAIPGIGTITIETKNVVLDETYCRFHRGFKPGEYMMIAFSDTGTGMDKETLEHIFEPFFTTKEEGKGTGLGLSTVYGIVKQNNGFINGYSEPGQGTTFKIYFPRHKGEVMDKSVATSNELMKGTETVLVVDDEKQILQLCEKTLGKLGYEVFTAKAPGEAVKLCQEYDEKIHLLLTDVVMPTMNGKELKEQIETIKPDINVIFMSGYPANVIVHRGVLAEGINFIEKPFSPGDLAKQVRQILDSKGAV